MRALTGITTLLNVIPSQIILNEGNIRDGREVAGLRTL